MPEETIIFCGDGNDAVSPQDFLRYFIRSMIAAACNSDASRAANFEYYLRTGSVADRWFQGLPASMKTLWPDLEAAFNRRWEPQVVVEKTQQELEEELSNYKLESKDLGKVIKVGGLDTHTHVAWAANVLRLAKDAGIAGGSNLIWIVRNNLPPVLKDLEAVKHATWADFAKAVTEAPIEKIREGVEKERVRAEEIALVKSRLQAIEKQQHATKQPVANYDDLTAQMQRLNLNNNRTQPPPARTAPARNQGFEPAANPAAMQGGGRGNIRYLKQPQQPPARRNELTIEEKRAMIARTTILTHHDDTPAGRNAYTTQMQDWTTTHGDIRVNENTPYPLRPGTAIVCSSECFRCGGHGHQSRECRVPEESRLPQRESAWRAICYTMLGPMNRGQAEQVMVVFAEYEDEQGNGEGL
ncbi:hypothetical protein BV22DRAFT_1022939 [Leucogyrophana mollusca]|uniref:Uncharacterized protein n=1 Tax=Leucogyrophana mollusca TaxID=85980 RepID=A0ACB8B0X1_9AGAM|nr:hypothetical protein BV22DRAFT_1022939 [Leucogyrophana mollusca]